MLELLSGNQKFTYSVRKKLINNMVKDYKFLSLGLIGKSWCGRPIEFIHLGNKENLNLWVASHHGMEWLTSLVVLKFLKNVCEKIKHNRKACGIDLKKCFEKQGLTVIPCLNPDGVEISLLGSQGAGRYASFVEKVSRGNTSRWQANARGVDLNHNYNAGWKELHAMEREKGILGPGPTRYGGNRPQSELETLALTSFCKKNNFNSAIAFHSQGEEIYWDYGKNTPKESENIANIMALAASYTVSKPEGLAVGGGFKDWFIKEFKKPAFTVEIGKGKNPLPASDLNSVYDKIEKMLYISSIMQV